MDNLYKVDYIEGKNLGCIALKSIKIGTIIVHEKPVCYDGGEIESETVHCIEGKKSWLYLDLIPKNEPIQQI